MIEYTKLFELLNERGMKRTDLLKIMSPQTLAKLGKNATVQSDIIDKVCLYLAVQPSDIMEVFKYVTVGNETLKRKVESPDAISAGIEYGQNTTGTVGVTLSELQKYVRSDGTLDTEKLDEAIRSLEKNGSNS